MGKIAYTQSFIHNQKKLFWPKPPNPPPKPPPPKPGGGLLKGFFPPGTLGPLGIFGFRIGFPNSSNPWKSSGGSTLPR